MKKVSTTAVREAKNFSEQKLTIGLDLGDRSSWYCVLTCAIQTTAHRLPKAPTVHTGSTATGILGITTQFSRGSGSACRTRVLRLATATPESHARSFLCINLLLSAERWAVCADCFGRRSDQDSVSQTSVTPAESFARLESLLGPTGNQLG
jgi:hypothetical protein